MVTWPVMAWLESSPRVEMAVETKLYLREAERCGRMWEEFDALWVWVACTYPRSWQPRPWPDQASSAHVVRGSSPSNVATSVAASSRLRRLVLPVRWVRQSDSGPAMGHTVTSNLTLQDSQGPFSKNVLNKSVLLQRMCAAAGRHCCEQRAPADARHAIGPATAASGAAHQAPPLRGGSTGGVSLIVMTLGLLAAPLFSGA